MKTLLFRLVGPMQSWGTQSRYTIRDTNLEPSKSGVIGLVYSALGKKRTEEDIDEPEKPSLEKLASLAMGVRIDRAGTMLCDYHTVGGMPPTVKMQKERNKESWMYLATGKNSYEAVISHRYYLSDAAFLVGLRGDPQIIEAIGGALARPKQQIFLGRKSFVPSSPVWLEDGISDMSLEVALQQYRSLIESNGPEPKDRRVCILETTSDDPMGIIRRDVPLSFARRVFTNRRVRIT